MRVQFDKDCIRIIPEGIIDETYLEHAVGLGHSSASPIISSRIGPELIIKKEWLGMQEKNR